MPASAVLRFAPWPVVAASLATVALLIAYPPVRIASRSAAAAPSASDGANAAASAFAPEAFAASFWTGRLQPAAQQAPTAGPVLAAIRRDPAAAVTAHGHRVGLGSAAYYFLRATGKVTAVERSRLQVEVDGTVVAVRTGPVFGNAVRDGSALLEVNQVPGLAEFNAVSAELNRLVEEQVLPALRTGIAAGATITFAGCAEAPESAPAEGPLLTFIPIIAEVSP